MEFAGDCVWKFTTGPTGLPCEDHQSLSALGPGLSHINPGVGILVKRDGTTTDD